ncbi:MAG: hypothetical protein QXG05_07920 [Nitrososphaerota archaeon]
MGRITPTFRQLYFKYLHKLSKHFVPFLRDKQKVAAFNIFVSKTWDYDNAAMANSEVPSTLDIMNLTAEVDNRAEIELLSRKLDELKSMYNKN